MAIFAWFQKRRAIRKAVRLYSLMKQNYGASTTYSVGQVQASIKRARISRNHDSYAYAVYLSRSDFDQLQRERGERCDYKVLRQEVSDVCGGLGKKFAKTEGTTPALQTYAANASESSDGLAADAGGDGGSD